MKTVFKVFFRVMVFAVALLTFMAGGYGALVALSPSFFGIVFVSTAAVGVLWLVGAVYAGFYTLLVGKRIDSSVNLRVR